ncbi:uncharacterized protein N7479_008919 [Penicillium vulpinum]|uniref:uncharacterized protein n=1 Tax=Penicillium vulpinum TaxID=29845 RepID=UPI0025480A42|nr:uncharacterized protein N7479_008919 [Penicillium vulpinum]KAJ5950506.1 hypothetical protein N7479_008919 [Penicillium vulpinum]
MSTIYEGFVEHPAKFYAQEHNALARSLRENEGRIGTLSPQMAMQSSFSAGLIEASSLARGDRTNKYDLGNAFHTLRIVAALMVGMMSTSLVFMPPRYWWRDQLP